MPEFHQAPRRWIAVTTTMIVMSLLLILVTGISLSVRQDHRKQEVEIATLKAQLAASKKSARDQDYVRCVAAIASTSIANQVIQSVRDIADGLAISSADQLDRDVAEHASAQRIETRRQALARWRRIRQTLTLFHIPACVRGG